MKKSEMLDISMGEDIDHSSINVRQEDKQKFKDLKQRLRSKNKVTHKKVVKEKEKEV
jgi:hypothetical protein